MFLQRRIVRKTSLKIERLTPNAQLEVCLGSGQRALGEVGNAPLVRHVLHQADVWRRITRAPSGRAEAEGHRVPESHALQRHQQRQRRDDGEKSLSLSILPRSMIKSSKVIKLFSQELGVASYRSSFQNIPTVKRCEK